MTLSDAVAGAVAALRRRPADILPFYLLGAAIPAIVRVLPFLGIAVAVVYLELSGRLDAALADLEPGALEPPDSEADPAAFDAWAEEVVPLAEQLFPLEVQLLAAAVALGSIVLAVVLYGAVSAGQLSACYGRLRDDRGLAVGLAGAERFWLRFVGLYLLEIGAWIAVGAIGIAGAALIGGALAAATGTGAAAALVALPALLAAAVAFAAIRAVFAFAPAAVVVDDAGVVGSLSATVGFLRRHPIAAGFYYVLAVGSTVALSALTSVFVVLEVPSIGALLTALVALPFLDLLKVGLYGGPTGRLSPPSAPERSFRRRVADGLRRGWAELGSFVRATPLLHAFVVAAAVGTFWAGWELADPLVGTTETSIAARLEGHVPPTAAVEFFGNNWTVAYTTAFGGLALAVPAFVALAFNGLVMGVTARLEVELAELAAFVLPHGLLEVPAILVAGALGLWLGAIGWRGLRGRASRREVVDALERAFWVVVGLGIVLAVAGFVEGFVSPYYYEPFL
ncbi:stage II sporulation protein M [Natronococcus sp. JC468]|uniref:stage II sporulation protein M n=1 Tax=Natronococcus sp. JC468 TaxID=1961921 RepID=UPI00143C2D4F|nr:stage II sporulation protein M [Natronococcus sp. JC468]NKE35455.1 stage II sporulation protein M [Natronococcus sp. JC468]